MLRIIIVALVFVMPRAARSATPKSRSVAVSNCGHYEVKPDFIMIACADGGNILEHLKWSVWSATSALATGVEEINDCEPSCADGKFHSYPVTVRLDNVRSGQFGRLRVIYSRRRPPRAGKIATFSFYNRQ